LPYISASDAIRQSRSAHTAEAPGAILRALGSPGETVVDTKATHLWGVNWLCAENHRMAMLLTGSYFVVGLVERGRRADSADSHTLTSQK